MNISRQELEDTKERLLADINKLKSEVSLLSNEKSLLTQSIAENRTVSTNLNNQIREQ